MKHQTEQEYGDDPVAVRESDKYQQEYVHAFVDKWDELIDWEGRAKAEGEFFIEKLRELGIKKVLDVATGTGFHSVQLLKAGFEVTSVDGSPTMLAKAFDNARKHGHILRTIHADWRMLNRDVHDLYDAVICLGNSFTHLHNENDRRKALAEYYATLRHDGILILDQRNYDAILDHQIEPAMISIIAAMKLKPHRSMWTKAWRASNMNSLTVLPFTSTCTRYARPTWKD